MKNSNKGITMVSLVVTIIVTMIIAGISIYGATSIMDYAKNTLNKYELAKITEEESIEQYENMVKGYKITMNKVNRKQVKSNTKITNNTIGETTTNTTIETPVSVTAQTIKTEINTLKANNDLSVDNLTAIKKVESEPSEEIKNIARTVSVDPEIIMWNEDNKLYWWGENATVALSRRL